VFQHSSVEREVDEARTHLWLTGKGKMISFPRKGKRTFVPPAKIRSRKKVSRRENQGKGKGKPAWRKEKAKSDERNPCSC